MGHNTENDKSRLFIDHVIGPVWIALVYKNKQPVLVSRMGAH